MPQPSDRSTRRTTSNLVATSVGCAPLKRAYEQAVALRPKDWGSIQAIFIRAMEEFDANVVAGIATMGDLQNGKGDFFNDMLALILEGCAGVRLSSRGAVPGLMFPKHNLDVTYPSSGPIQFILEAKAVGTPKHAGSPKQKAIGRPGSADLDKRVKEIGFKTIDLKAEYARILTQSGESPHVMSGDLTTWLRAVKPKSYVFFAARAISDSDRNRVVQFANVANLVSDGVGVFCFGPSSIEQSTTYRALAVPAFVSIDRVLFRACQDLRAVQNSIAPIPTEPSPSEIADDMPLDQDNGQSQFK